MTANSTTSRDQTSAVVVSEYQPGIVLMTLDMPNKGANILSESMFAELDQAITPLMARDDIQGLILFSAKPRIFVAGADLVAISKTLDWPDEDIVKFCDDGRAVMAKFSQTAFPTVAAIHGACVGGGFELTLWCDRRIACGDRRTILGLPEVKLGLVPGWGGTVRVARICKMRGKPDAIPLQLDLVTSGRIVDSPTAAEIGLVDQVTTQDKLLQTAVELIEADFESGQYLTNRETLSKPLTGNTAAESYEKEFSLKIGENKNIYPFAPTVALEHMLRAVELPLKEACDSESIAMAQVWGSPASHGLINFFFLGEHNKKNPGFVNPTLTPRDIDEVGIVGAGVMGRAIAACNLNRRKSVRLLDSNSDLSHRVVAEISASITTESTSMITAAGDYRDFAACDLVIESVIEKKDIKTEVLKRVEANVSEAAIIATNTSAISISELAAELNDPGRFCGIHFCHPDAMQLVEVVKGDETTDQTMVIAIGYVRSLGKMPIAVKDRPGFVVNRLLAAMLKQAFRLFAEGQSIEVIDGAMRDFGFLAGPFEMVDIIGADTCFQAGLAMWNAGLTCVSELLILPRMVKVGRLGRKTNHGFYRYSAEAAAVDVDPATLKELQPYIQGDSKSAMSVEQIVNEILSAVVLEATKILDEKIAADFRDIDLCAIHGFSFPPEHGGILFWADQIGVAKVVRQLNQLGQSDEHMVPNQRLVEMAERGAKFYGSTF